MTELILKNQQMTILFMLDLPGKFQTVIYSFILEILLHYY